MKKYRVIIATGVVVATMFMLTGCGAKKISLNDYISIEADGYDSMGEATYSFDYESFYNDFSDTIKVSPKYKSELENMGYYPEEAATDAFLSLCVDQQLDNTSDLSNGDTITLTWLCDDEMAENYFNCKLDYSDITYTVEGLKEVGEFNPFDYLTVEFDGISSAGTINITPDYSQSEMTDIYFEADMEVELSNGDVVTVTADPEEDTEYFVEEYGNIVTPLEKTYTVEGLKTYATSASQIPQETLDKMVQQGKDAFYSYVANEWVDGYKIKAVDYVGNYFLSLKEGMEGDQNCIYIVYKIKFVENDGNTYTFYYQVRFKDMVVDGNGTCEVSLADYEKTSDKFEYADGKYSVDGYGTINSLYEKVIQPQIEFYTYENNITE